MSDTLNSLKALSNSQQKIHNPFQDTVDTQKKSYVPKSSGLKSKSTYDTVSKISKKIDKLYKETNTEIDTLLDDIELSDQNITIRSSLISMGRKYARDHDSDGDENEVSRAFSPQEMKLNDLYSEVSKDIDQIDKDLVEMRMMHTGRNMQRMTELINAKAQYHNTRLSILKEISSIKKSQFDIKSKINKDKPQDGDNSMLSSSIIQSVFGMGHESILDSVGGRTVSSGANVGSVNESPDYYDEPDDLVIEEDDSEGDKFIQYENAGVELVLEEYDDGTKKVYAEDRDGNKVHDYPIPNDINSLTFDINTRAEIATDQLQRNYKYRRV